MSDTIQHIAPSVAPLRRRIRWSMVMDHTVLILGSLFMLVPILIVFQTTTTPDVETMKYGPSFALGNELGTNFQEL